MCLSNLWLHQSIPVVNYSPRCHSDGHDLTLRGAAQGVVPHSPPDVLHHTSLCATGDDPRTCLPHSICPNSILCINHMSTYCWPNSTSTVSYCTKTYGKKYVKTNKYDCWACYSKNMDTKAIVRHFQMSHFLKCQFSAGCRRKSLLPAEPQFQHTTPLLNLNLSFLHSLFLHRLQKTI